MCGRDSFAVEPKEVEKRFGAEFVGEYKSRYNAAPSQALPVILNNNPRKIVMVRWGIKPPWLEKVAKRDGLINVRFETLRDKRTFHKDLADRRCLIPADGFYEWKAEAGKRKVPYRITRKDGKMFAFAGIWEENPEGDKTEPHFAIITTAADDFMAPIHKRMPVILDESEERQWLSASDDQGLLLGVLASPFKTTMRAYAVSTAVNSARVDDKAIIAPL